jgi:hypothetical protein
MDAGDANSPHITAAHRLRANATRKRRTEMQVSQSNKLEGGRGFHSIGRIKASSEWRSVDAPIAEADRLTAVRALIREAEECDADAIIDLVFEINGVKRADIDGVPLQRVVAVGIAVKFAEVA